MNNQEMHFSDPEWPPPQQGNLNIDPSEQSHQQNMPPEQERVYREYAPYAESQAEKIGVGQYIQKPRRRRRLWLWLIVVLIAFALIGRIATLYSGCPPPPPHSWSAYKPISFPVGAHPTTVIGAYKPISFSVGAHPTIMIENGFNTTDVHAGSAQTVTLHLAGQNLGSGNLPEIDYDQSKDSNTITVMVNVPPDMVNVSLEVTVPSHADVRVDTNTGEIDVTGVSGQMDLEATSGAIKATQDSLSGQSILHTTDSSLTFNGSLDPKGTYLFQSTDGPVAVTLPGNSSFHVDAWTHSSFSSTFPEVSIQLLTCSITSASGDVGSPPRARVILQTTASSISLNKR